MRRLPLLRAAVIALALLAPPLGCKVFGGMIRPSSGSPEPPPMPDEPPPLHTGGLSVMTSSQGAGSPPGSHGDPTAEAIATGVGLAAFGTGAATTAAKCAQPDASVTCLRGPSPLDNTDAGPR